MKHLRKTGSFLDNRVALIIGLAALALIMRVVVLLLFSRTYFWDGIWSDSAMYNQWAHRIVTSGDWLGHEAFFMTPLYPYFLAVVYSIFGFSFLAVRIVQLLAGTATVLVIFLIGEKLFSRKAAMLAGIIAALYGPFLLSNNLILVETLKVFFLTSAVLLLLVAREKSEVRWWLFAGLSLGLAILSRPTDTLALLAATVWLLALPGPAFPARLVRLALVTGGVLLLVIPVAVRNHAVSGDTVLITSNGGLNFYLGNNPRAVGIYYNVDDIDLVNDPDGRLAAETTLKKALRPSEVSSYYMGKALSYIATEPLDFLRLMGKKALLFFHRKEIGQMGYSYGFIADTSIPLLAVLPAFSVIGPLALLGVVLYLKEVKRLRLLYFILIAEFLGVVLFFVTDRFRLSAMPFLILFAGAALATLHERWKSGGWKKLGSAPVLLLVVILPVDLLNYRLPDDFSLEYENIGLIHFRAKQYPEAMEAYRKALRYRNGYHIHNSIGDVYLATRHPREALAEYSAANSLDPHQPFSAFGAGSVYTTQQNWPWALAAYEKAIEISPGFAAAYLNKGLTLYYMQRYPEALASLERYTQLEKDSSKLATVYKDIENLKAIIAEGEK